MSTEDFAAVRTRVWSSLERALEGGPAADHVAGVRRALAPHLAPSADDTAESAPPAEPLSDADRTTLELVIRMFLDDLLRRAKESKAVIADAKVPELLDLTLELTRQGVTEYNTAFALIEDIFDSQLISELEIVFSLIEARASQLGPFLSMNNPKCTRSRLTLIRACNEVFDF